MEITENYIRRVYSNSALFLEDEFSSTKEYESVKAAISDLADEKSFVTIKDIQEVATQYLQILN